GRRRSSPRRGGALPHQRRSDAAPAHRPRLDGRYRADRRTAPPPRRRRPGHRAGADRGHLRSLSGFVHPGWLLSLIAVATEAAAYVLVQIGRRRKAVRFASLEMLDSVTPRRRRWFVHVPAVLLVLSLTALTIAAAGPTADHKVPRNRATVMLAIDVSLSMQATDVQPSRLEAAQDAAKSFVDKLPDGINLGLVSFAGTASVLVSPTTNRQSVVNAIDNLQLAERTATGEAIFTSLQAIENFAAGLGGGDNVPPAR